MLFVCAALTVLIEVPWMYLWGLKSRDGLLLAVCVNLVTNLVLNMGLSLGFPGGEVGALIYLFEAAVVAAEYGIYALALGFSKKLFLITLGANCLSYGIGLLIF